MSSRVAKQPIVLPTGVELVIENQLMQIKGPKGLIRQHYNKSVKIMHDATGSNTVTFEPNADENWKHAGTARALMNNMVVGVTKGFSKRLELIGVGYRAQVSGSQIVFSLGFSHPVPFALPEGIGVEVTGNTVVEIKGIDKQLVGQVSAKIRELRPPEPYKGKGIRYAGEIIHRKEAKKK